MIYWIVSVLAWGLTAFFLRRRRIWLFYYIWTAVGFTILAILMLRYSPVEYGVERLTGLFLHHGLDQMGIKTMIFDKAPGTVLVLLALENSWTCIDIDIECSGLLEACVLLGLLWFYPALDLGRKFLYTGGGIIALFLINLLRLFAIVAIINWGGRDTMFVSHTLIGRLIFFLLVIVVYWYIFTRPTLQRVRRRADNA